MVSASYIRLKESGVFTAFSLITHRSNWLTVEYLQKDVEEEVRDAERYEIFNLVVIENHKVKGSINVKDLCNGDWDHCVPLSSFTINPSTPIPNLVETFSKDSRDTDRKRSPVYFVNSTNGAKQNPLGILTFWDLNRAPVYILSTLVVTFVEQSLLDQAKNAYFHKDQIDLLSCTQRVRDYIEAMDFSPSRLSEWYFHDFISLIRSDETIRMGSLPLSGELVSALEGTGNDSFRNRVNHSNKLVVRDDDINFTQDLHKLCVVMTEGLPWIDEFTNPKVSYTSRLPKVNASSESFYI